MFLAYAATVFLGGWLFTFLFDLATGPGRLINIWRKMRRESLASLLDLDPPLWLQLLYSVVYLFLVAVLTMAFTSHEDAEYRSMYETFGFIVVIRELSAFFGALEKMKRLSPLTEEEREASGAAFGVGVAAIGFPILYIASQITLSGEKSILLDQIRVLVISLYTEWWTKAIAVLVLVICIALVGGRLFSLRVIEIGARRILNKAGLGDNSYYVVRALFLTMLIFSFFYGLHTPDPVQTCAGSDCETLLSATIIFYGAQVAGLFLYFYLSKRRAARSTAKSGTVPPTHS